MVRGLCGWLRCLVLLGMFLARLPVAEATIYWVSGSGGSTAGSCAAASGASDPGVYLRTIEAGMACPTAGDTVNIKTGTYAEEVNPWTNKAGTSFSNPITIQGGIGGETIWSVPSSTGQALRIENVQYAIFKNITWDGTNGTNGTPDYKSSVAVPGADRLIHISCTDAVNLTGCAAHLRFQQNILRNTAYIAVGISDVADIQFLSNEIYNITKLMNGAVFYHSGRDSLYDGNYIHDVASTVFNLWNQESFTVHNNIVRNNRLERAGIWWAPTAQNGTPECCFAQSIGLGGTCSDGQSCTRFVQGQVAPFGSGIFLTRGDGNQAYNNVITDSYGTISASHGATGCLIANNSINGNRCSELDSTVYITSPCPGISLGSTGGGANSCVVRNNIAYQPELSGAALILSAAATGNASGQNLCSTSTTDCPTSGNPLYVSPSTGNLQLSAGSPAIDAGATISSITTDILGVSRPQGLGYDIGAYEFTAVQNSYTVSRSAPTVAAGQQITASWLVTPGPAEELDWIGLVRSGDVGQNYIAVDGIGDQAWVYTQAALTGNFTLIAPFLAGDFEFLYCINDTFTCPARSAPFTITAQ